MLELMSGSEAVATEKKPKRLWLLVAVTAIVLSAVTLGILLQLRSQPPIPAEIQQQLDFSPFIVVSNNKNSKVVVTSYKYDKSNMLLSFIIVYGGETFTVSEQSSPSEFTDIPDAYQKLLDELNSYETVQTFNGPLSLTHPKADPLTTGLLNSSGVLMFIRANQQSVSDGDWRNIVESMSIYKIVH